MNEKTLEHPEEENSHAKENAPQAGTIRRIEV